MKRLLLILVVGLLLLGACTPASVSEPAIPAHFTTFTDKAGYFSISYPPDWELALSKIEVLTQDVEDYLKSIESKGSSVGGNTVFFAGIPYETGHNPNVTVIVTPSVEGKWKLGDVVEAIVKQGYMKDAEEYHEFSRTWVTVDGREAIIVDLEAEYPHFTVRLHVLQMFLRADKLIWVVTCGVLSPKDFNDFETDLHAIVRSLRILK
ncbi:hypothetical protein ACFLXT_05040 [Chloroflexota bacterium]